MSSADETNGTPRRNRLLRGALIVLVIAAGLASWSAFAAAHLHAFITAYAGDTLWALTLFLVLGFLAPAARTETLFLLTFILAFAVEFSQLYQADWINAIRGHGIGALLLGRGFLWSDLVCYTAGCLIGGVGEVLGKALQNMPDASA